ncbi:DNA replication/repair protein RecF [Wenzhouxiangella sp. EGI_FJ10305]|uniref:DNA replication/repair protein RecF n=1 Tax=Wenzhouxiangella sp. EGI_FJ10305 TaxID=3243768 RepID=UPI0035D56706
MSLDRLSIRGVRNLEPLELSPAPGMNWFCGPNGAGKTSILEAIYLLARGRSFRTARITRVIQKDADALTVVARRADTAGRLGVERDADGWRGRIDGRDCQRISEFAALLPLTLIEPGSHALIDGGPERRRQFLDWQLFHVEHEYLAAWQRFARLLRQRNAALKARAADKVLDALEPEFLRGAEAIGRARRALVERLSGYVTAMQSELGFRLPGSLELRYRGGYPEDADLATILHEKRDRDRERGFTQYGPHRAELVLRCDGQAAAEMSRGQQKLVAVVLLLAQYRLLKEGQTLAPVLLIDDPVSELDADHLEALLSWLQRESVQSWITATSASPVSARMFHVEQGRVDRG